MGRTKKQYFRTRKTLKGGARNPPPKSHQELINIEGQEYQGADVLIINEYAGVDHVVLFKDAKPLTAGQNPSYSLAGGRFEASHDSLEHTIESELYEESKKTIRISKCVFKYMTKLGHFVVSRGDTKHGKYGLRRCYICRVPHISTTLYEQNKSIMNELTSPDTNPTNYEKEAEKLRSFMETDEMLRIPLSALSASITRNGAGKITDDGRARDIDIRIGTVVKRVHITSITMKAFVKASIENDNWTTKPFPMTFDLSRAISERWVNYIQKPNDNEAGSRGKIDQYS